MQHKDNDRLKLLLETLVSLTHNWMKGEPGSHCGMIADQIRFIRKMIREELIKR